MIDRVSLRTVHVDDLPAFYEHQADPEAIRMSAFPARERDDFMAHWAKIMVDEDAYLRTVVFEGQVAGNVASWSVGEDRLVGYVIGRDFWGKGIATAAVGLMLGEVPFRPLQAHVAVHNIGSLRVLQKNGFVITSLDKIPEPDADLGDEYVLTLEG